MLQCKSDKAASTSGAARAYRRAAGRVSIVPVQNIPLAKALAMTRRSRPFRDPHFSSQPREPRAVASAGPARASDVQTAVRTVAAIKVGPERLRMVADYAGMDSVGKGRQCFRCEPDPITGVRIRLLKSHDGP